jgi:uncharacterized protein YceK
MFRWLPTAALLVALVLTAVTGCSSSPTTGGGKGTAPTTSAGTHTGKAPDTGKDTGQGAGHHDPG